MTEIVEYFNVHAGWLLESWMVMNLQVAMFAGAIWIIDSFLKSASPRLRYLLWMAALIKAMIPPVFSFPAASGVAAAVSTLPAVTVSLFAEPASGGLSMQAVVLAGLMVASVALVVVAVLRHIKLRLSLRDAVPFKENADPDVSWPKLLTSSRIFSPLAAGLVNHGFI